MAEQVFKNGQKVVATGRSGVPTEGKVVATVPGPRGSFIEVKHGEVSKRYRPSQVAAA